MTRLKRRRPKRGPARLTDAFLQERVTLDGDATISTNELFGAFLEWMQDQPDRRFVDIREWDEVLRRRRIRKKETDAGWVFCGLSLDDEDPKDGDNEKALRAPVDRSTSSEAEAAPSDEVGK